MKQLLIKLGLWEDSKSFEEAKYNGSLPTGKILVDEGWLQIAMKHSCGICERWFADTRGKLMHDRHRHKDA